MNKPLRISDAEWREIMTIPKVIEAWGLDGNDDVAFLKENVYGVKFNFISGSPGYVGKLYLLHGNYLGNGVMTFIKRKGKICLDEDYVCLGRIKS